MTQGLEKPCHCGGPAEIVSDLIEEDLLELRPGERLWKLYCFQDADHPTRLRHRIYTKEKVDGRLAMLTFAVHNPPRDERDPNEAPSVRSALARVPDLAASDLERLIRAMQAAAASSACEEVDLTGQRRLDDQLAWLRNQVA